MKKINLRKVFQTAVLVFATSVSSWGQKSETVTVAANARYDKAGQFKRVLFGEHYRKEWATPVEIEVLDPGTFAGGLTPIKMGGGLQTLSLRLAGADGREYVLRSVDKDPSKALAAELRGTFAEDFVQDQISSSNPFAPMVVASLEEAAGIFHTNPRLVYVENSTRLASYDSVFGGTVCLIEERPAGNGSNLSEFGQPVQILNSQRLFERIFSNTSHRVDAKSFLKARLLDMLVGDWDRHPDQWLWAEFRSGEEVSYKPIPRDRDQAFAKMDGVIPYLATRKWALRNVQGYDYTIKDLNGLNAAGGFLDRIFLTGLEKRDWLHVAREVQESLSDSVIDAAFRKLPDPIYNISGRKTRDMLVKRRNDLEKYAAGYYRFLSEEVNIIGSQQRETYKVRRLNNDSTEVQMYRGGSGSKHSRLVYERIFLRQETKEIRLYGMGGDDVFEIEGDVKKGIIIRVIGGPGADSVNDESSVKGWAHKTKVYDNQSSGISTRKEARNFISNDSLKNNYALKPFRFDVFAPAVTPGFNADDGLFLGGGMSYKKQQYGKTPYGWLQSIAANYSFGTGAYAVWYKGVFREAIGKSDLHLSLRYRSPSYVRNYYGFGNETTRRSDVGKEYYRIRMSEFTLSSTLQRQLGKYHRLWMGSEVSSTRLEENQDRFTSSEGSKIDSVDYRRKNFGTFKLGYRFSTLNSDLYPLSGIKVEIGAGYTRNMSDRDRDYVNLNSEVSLYQTKGRFTLANRLGAATNLGNDYEFYQANTLGGLTNLRGFRRDRFTGKTSVFQTTELRARVGQFNAYFTKGTWGLLAFADHGRVWVPGESSKTWHHGYGGGVWFLPFEKMAMTATYGISKEDKLLSVTAGFLF
jgi:hypothetical protein